MRSSNIELLRIVAMLAIVAHHSRIINAIALTTFGVLLIHAASDGMRECLWQYFVNVPAAYDMSLPILIGYSVLVMFGVFFICSALDYLRIRFIEGPVFRYLNHQIR